MLTTSRRPYVRKGLEKRRLSPMEDDLQQVKSIEQSKVRNGSTEHQDVPSPSQATSSRGS
jgi:hypothetical protein